MTGLFIYLFIYMYLFIFVSFLFFLNSLMCLHICQRNSFHLVLWLFFHLFVSLQFYGMGSLHLCIKTVHWTSTCDHREEFNNMIWPKTSCFSDTYCTSLFWLCKGIHGYHFFYIYIIWNDCYHYMLFSFLLVVRRSDHESVKLKS